MPHDAKGRVIQVGDKVLIPGTVKAIHSDNEYYNCDVELEYPMPAHPDQKQRYSAINTRQVELAVVPPDQPPVDNDHVAEGCEKLAHCMNTLTNSEETGKPQMVHCAWEGQVENLATDPCPRCGEIGRLSPVVEVGGSDSGTSQLPNTAREMPRYKCHKEVWALKIAAIDEEPDPPNSIGCARAVITPADAGYGPFTVDGEFMAKHKPQVGGYYIAYSDGYKSFSPAQPFEEGYFLVSGAREFSYVNPSESPVVDGLEYAEVVYAKDQPQYKPLRTIVSNHPDRRVMSRWTPTDYQRQQIFLGADLYLTLLTFGNPLHPILLAVSKGINPDWISAEFNIPKQVGTGK